LPELEEFIRTYSISILIGVVSAVILGAAAALVVAMRQRAAARREEEAFLRVRKVATIVEEIRITGAGRMSWLLLGSTAFFLCVSYYYSVETVDQRVGLGVLLAFGLFIFGLGRLSGVGEPTQYTSIGSECVLRMDLPSKRRRSNGTPKKTPQVNIFTE